MGALAQLSGGLNGEWTLIGGLAVMVRLTSAHRSTSDIDTIARAVSPDGRAVLVAQGAVSTANGVSVNGIKIDIIDIASDLDLDNLPSDVSQRMFVLAHWWMAASANPTRIRLVDQRTSQRRTSFETTIRLAGPARLVAAKLQSHPYETRNQCRQAVL